MIDSSPGLLVKSMQPSTRPPLRWDNQANLLNLVLLWCCFQSVVFSQAYVPNSTVIEVLDIYGFEIFGKNSFEQFCINYCNEKLQQLFIELVLQQEQEEYKREGIQWEHIDYFNNMVICQLIDESHKGIIAIMDEACLNVGKITDPMLLEEMDRKLAGHKHYNSRRFKLS